MRKSPEDMHVADLQIPWKHLEQSSGSRGEVGCMHPSHPSPFTGLPLTTHREMWGNWGPRRKGWGYAPWRMLVGGWVDPPGLELDLGAG